MCNVAGAVWAYFPWFFCSINIQSVFTLFEKKDELINIKVRIRKQDSSKNVWLILAHISNQKRKSNITY